MPRRNLAGGTSKARSENKAIREACDMDEMGESLSVRRYIHGPFKTGLPRDRSSGSSQWCHNNNKYGLAPRRMAANVPRELLRG